MMVNLSSVLSVAFTLAFSAFSSSAPLQRTYLTERQAPAGFLPTGPFLGEFPDPCLIPVNGSWFAYSTSTANPPVNIPIAISPNLTTWSRITDPITGTEVDALPKLPPWVNLTASPAGVWAPDVAEWIPGRFTLLFSALTVENPREHCVGVATASTPNGPFTPIGTEPLICPLAQGGAIDASHFRDPATGNYYVTYKIDGGSMNTDRGSDVCATNAASNNSTPLMLQKIADPQSFALSGSPIPLLDNRGAADESDIEAPSLLYIPPLLGDSSPAAVRKRTESFTAVDIVVTTTECPEDEPSSISSLISSAFGNVPTPPTGGAVSKHGVWTYMQNQSASTSSSPDTASPVTASPSVMLTVPAPSHTESTIGEVQTPVTSLTNTAVSGLLPNPIDSTPPTPLSSALLPSQNITSAAPPLQPQSTESATFLLQPTTFNASVFPTSAASISSNLSASEPSSSTTTNPSSSNNTSGTYILFFSPGCFADWSYAIAYAVSTSGVAGPYIRQPDLLRTGDGGLVSPGGLTAVGPDPASREATVLNSQPYAEIVYHAGRLASGGTRSLYSGRAAWNGSAVAILGLNGIGGPP